MKHVDCLSRYPVFNLSYDALTLRLQPAIDEFLSGIKTAVATTPVDGYFLGNDILYKTVRGCDLLVVPQAM